MKKLSKPIAAMALLLLLVAVLEARAEVTWVDDSYENIIERAKAETKYVLIDFYTVWCGPCKQMDKETYTDEKVKKFLADLIPVKYDSEKGVGIALSKKYRVSAWPTTILLNPDGEEVDRYLGFLNADKFVKVMGDYIRGIGTVEHYQAMVGKNPDDPEAWKSLGMKYGDAGLVPEAKEALNRFTELAPHASVDEKAEVFYKLAKVHYEGGSYTDAAQMFEELMAKYAGSEYMDDVTTLLARCYHKLGDADKCVATYLTYVDRHPDDPKAMNSFAWFCATRKVGLDEALPLARKAVQLSDRHPGYLDTLAELHFARGEYDSAIEIGLEAAEKEPGDAYFADQVKKFRKAKE
ncbi:MAG: tetratricopeptide repeat protein [Candidatus Krumholzibacteria bacterium]|nr:tetratricopeptide repeat protein [Candidatus Krumholzibacteria bacterium]